MKIFLLCIVCLLLLARPSSVAAGIYMYVDKDGVRHFTNAPTSRRYKSVRLEKLNTPRPGSVAVVKRKGFRAVQKRSTSRYDHHIKQAALSNRVDPLLIKAIIKAESAFDPYAVSRSGAQGLMQLMPGTARDLRVGNPFDPAENISGGTRYFRTLLNSYEGNLSLSLAAYNAGPGRVAKKGPLPMIQETREYVRRVIRNYRSYQQTAGSPIPQNINERKLVTVN